MNSIIINSENNKYKIQINRSNLTDIYDIILYNNMNNEIIYNYSQNKFCHDSFNRFIVINNETWWFGCKNYQYKILINCDKGKIYCDPDKQEFINYENIFIWTGPFKLSPLNDYLLIEGYIVGQRQDKIYQLYCINDIDNKGIINVSYNNIFINIDNKGIIINENDIIFGDKYINDKNNIKYNLHYHFNTFDNNLDIIVYISNESYNDIFGYYKIKR